MCSVWFLSNLEDSCYNSLLGISSVTDVANPFLCFLTIGKDAYLYICREFFACIFFSWRREGIEISIIRRRQYMKVTWKKNTNSVVTVLWYFIYSEHKMQFFFEAAFFSFCQTRLAYSSRIENIDRIRRRKKLRCESITEADWHHLLA